MDSIVERVARALREVEWGQVTTWDDADDGDRNYWLTSARAALEAMREPSGLMATEGAQLLFGWANDDPADDAKLVYRAMIDAALEN